MVPPAKVRLMVPRPVGGQGVGAARDREIGVHSRILHVVHGAGTVLLPLDIAIAVGRKDARRVNARRPANACVTGTAEYVRAGESGWRESARGSDLRFRLTDFERAASGVRHDIELARIYDVVIERTPVGQGERAAAIVRQARSCRLRW